MNNQVYIDLKTAPVLDAEEMKEIANQLRCSSVTNR